MYAHVYVKLKLHVYLKLPSLFSFIKLKTSIFNTSIFKLKKKQMLCLVGTSILQIEYDLNDIFALYYA